MRTCSNCRQLKIVCSMKHVGADVARIAVRICLYATLGVVLYAINAHYSGDVFEHQTLSEVFTKLVQIPHQVLS